jgi:hypothetical protein
MRLDLIPYRWLEYQPPGACHMPMLGVVGSLGGMMMSMMGQQQQASYQAAVARNNAIALRQKANEEAAVGQREAITESRKADIVQSRARALGAASGTAVASPTQVNTEAGIGAQGDYNALSALYEGGSKEQAANYQASLELFKARQIESASSMNMMSSVFSGISSLAKGVGGMSSGGGSMFGGAGTANSGNSYADMVGTSQALQAPVQTTANDDLSELFRRRGTPGLNLWDLLK